jgi:hypothetical protein
MRRLALAAVLLVAPLSLVACGGGSSSSGSSTVSAQITPVAYVKSAASNTAAQESVHVALKAAVAVSGEALSMSGAGDFAKDTGSVHVDFSAGGMSGGVDAVLDGTDLYLRSPLLAAALPQGKSWIKVDASKAAGRGVNLSSLVAQSPAQTLARLRSISTVTEVGTEQLDGVTTTHYRGRATKGATAPAGTYDVWIGKDDDYVHRLKFAAVLGPGQRIDTTVDFSDFGKTVTVDVPPASETVDASTLKLPGLTS